MCVYKETLTVAKIIRSPFYKIICFPPRTPPFLCSNSRSKCPCTQPFCTIDPSFATVPMPDKRFEFLCEAFQPKSRIQAILNITDIAGLVKGAHEGKGLGNAFLSHIQAVDGIYHLCRAFADKDIEHTEGTVDPVRDLEIISNELIQKVCNDYTSFLLLLLLMSHFYSELRSKSGNEKKGRERRCQYISYAVLSTVSTCYNPQDLNAVNTAFDAANKIVTRGIDKTKGAMDKRDALAKAKKYLEDGIDIREGDWEGNQIETLNELQLLTAKPIVYLVNISKDNFETQKNKWLMDIKAWCKKRSPDSPVVPFSAPFEKYIDDLPEEVRTFVCSGVCLCLSVSVCACLAMCLSRFVSRVCRVCRVCV